MLFGRKDTRLAGEVLLLDGKDTVALFDEKETRHWAEGTEFRFGGKGEVRW